MKRSSFTRVLAVALAASMMIPSASAAFWAKEKTNDGKLASLTGTKDSHWTVQNSNKNDKNNNSNKNDKNNNKNNSNKNDKNNNKVDSGLNDILGGNDWGNNWGNNWGSDWESILGDWGTGGIFGELNSQSKDETAGEEVPGMILVEDQSTVEPGTELRASTYMLASEEPEAAAASTFALRSADSGVALAAEGGTQIKYFPITLINYKDYGSGSTVADSGINAATKAADQAAGGGVTTTTTTTTYPEYAAKSLKWSDLITSNATDKTTNYLWKGENGEYYRADEEQRERCYSVQEIRVALEKNGFETVDIFADTSFSAPTEQSERLYFVARVKK